MDLPGLPGSGIKRLDNRPCMRGMRLGVSALLSLLLAGCASLPEVSTPPQLATMERPGVCAKAAAPAPAQQGGLGDFLSRHAPPAMQRFRLVEAASGGPPLVGGNRITLLENGAQTYAAMWQALQQAHDHIDIETYALDPEGFGKQLADLLLRKRAAGVRVHIIYDSIGSMNTPPAFFDRLRAAGVELLEYSPFHPLRTGITWQLNNRDHRRILAIDGMVVFTGGLNISDVYSHAPAAALQKDYRNSFWRDTDIRLEGPAVAEFEKLFLQLWRRVTGVALADSNFFPPLRARGRELVHVLVSAPAESNASIYRAYLGAIRAARHHIYITQAFFVPDEQLMRALADAAACGVDVRIILPESSGNNLVMMAGRGYYERMLRAGVRIYEYQKGVLHAKMAEIDGVWSTVGSANFDYRSFLLNEELNVDVLDRAFAHQMETLFWRDLADAKEVQPEQWYGRSPMERLKEEALRTIRYFL